jgi:hypothetical protein
MLKKSKTIQGQQGDAMQNKFLRGYIQSKGFCSYGVQRGDPSMVLD